jgi:hypothetical protein
MNKISKSFKKAIGYVLGIPAAIFVASAPAMASAPTITVPDSVDTTALFEVVGVVLVGLFAMWGIRKVIKLSNRS